MGRYQKIIEWIFNQKYQLGQVRIAFNREELVKASEALGLERIKNLGDIEYTFRFRRELPHSIQQTAPEGAEWITVGAGIGEYQFRLAAPGKIQLNPHLQLIKVPDATPEIVRHYAPGQDDEIYVGLNRRGAHFVLPCQTKSPDDKFGIVQVMQDLALCHTRYPNAICKPIALQFIDEEVRSLMECE